MTLLQIQIAVTVARCGSVSTAAEAMGISQPNASNAIRSIEAEFGAKLFRRTSRGIALTEHGYRFLDHAAELLRQYDSLTSLYTEEPGFRLRLGITHYTPAVNAFLRLFSELSESQRTELSYLNLSASKGISLLNERKLDLIVCVLPVSFTAHFARMLEEFLLIAKPICSSSISIKLRKEHPVLQSGAATDIDTLLWELRQYPYVEYQSLSSLEELRQYRILPNLQYRNLLCVDERDSRFMLLQQSNAFSVGSFSPEKLLQSYGLMQIPVPEVEAEIQCLVRKGEENRSEIQHYMKLLRTELAEEMQGSTCRIIEDTSSDD